MNWIGSIFSPKNSSRIVLTERVKTAIRVQQNTSERLVGWFQLAVVILFGLLYTASPKTFSTEHTFVLVPWFLSIYVGLTLIRILISYRHSLSMPLLYLSIVFDIGLLLAMIWAFHLQYRQPPVFYLKSPTMLYVFIFIALRALRFETRYVIAAGLLAASGWALLAGYALYASGGMESVTRDYVYYMTSNSILIGAELDKIIAILTVTAILAVVIQRARQLLIVATAEGTAAQDLSRFFAPEIAHRITAAEQVVKAGQGQVRYAAVLNTDIRGFTKLTTTVEPDELMHILAEYQSRLVPVIQEHGGSIDKFMGDGILATFGAALPTDTYAADALRAIDEIMNAAQAWLQSCRAKGKPELRIGAAVATGRVIFGAVGDQSRLEYTVIGDAVNLSAKLEKHTKTENVSALCDAATFELATKQGYRTESDIRKLPGRRIAGVADPVNIVVLFARPGPGSNSPGSRP